jgi:DNA-binding CsgD family transcriptional regulator
MSGSRGSKRSGSAERFARRSLVNRARPLLEQAVEIYERLDGARDLARTEAVLAGRESGAAAGEHAAARNTAGRALTSTEQTVARLVAEGLSNPQIGDRLYVSRRTVQTHLAHVFTKLDISSRTQLAAEVAGNATPSRQPGRTVRKRTVPSCGREPARGSLASSRTAWKVPRCACGRSPRRAFVSSAPMIIRT